MKRRVAIAAACVIAAAGCSSARGLDHDTATNGTPGCRIETSSTPEGWELIFYPRHAERVPTGFAVPCPK